MKIYEFEIDMDGKLIFSEIVHEFIDIIILYLYLLDSNTVTPFIRCIPLRRQLDRQKAVFVKKIKILDRTPQRFNHHAFYSEPGQLGQQTKFSETRQDWRC